MDEIRRNSDCLCRIPDPVQTVRMVINYLMLACMAVGPDFLVGEEVRGDDLLDLAPVLAVGRKGDARGAIEEDVGGRGVGPGREDVVLRAEDGLRRARRGDDDRRYGAEVEEHEAVAAMPGGEVTERDVREGADEVQVADDGEPPGRRRQLAQQLFSGCRQRCSKPAAHEKSTDDEQDRNH